MSPANLLLAHSLFPEFPSLGVLLLIVLVGGAVFAFVSRRSRHVVDEPDTPDAVVETSSIGTGWLRIPVVTLIACGLAVPLSLVPGIGLIASIVLMPGWIVLWMLFMSDVLQDDSDNVSFVVMAAASWVVWTASALILSHAIAWFRDDAPNHSSINSIR